MTQYLHIPGPLPGMNEILESAKGAGGSGTNYSTLKKQWTETVWAYAKSKRLHPVQRASIRFEWHEKNRLRDPDNVCAFAKFALDGLVKAEVLPGDGWDAIAGLAHSFIVDPKRHGVTIAIEEQA